MVNQPSTGLTLEQARLLVQFSLQQQRIASTLQPFLSIFLYCGYTSYAENIILNNISYSLNFENVVLKCTMATRVAGQRTTTSEHDRPDLLTPFNIRTYHRIVLPVRPVSLCRHYLLGLPYLTPRRGIQTSTTRRIWLSSTDTDRPTTPKWPTVIVISLNTE